MDLTSDIGYFISWAKFLYKVVMAPMRSFPDEDDIYEVPKYMMWILIGLCVFVLCSWLL